MQKLIGCIAEEVPEYKPRPWHTYSSLSVVSIQANGQGFLGLSLPPIITSLPRHHREIFWTTRRTDGQTHKRTISDRRVDELGRMRLSYRRKAQEYKIEHAIPVTTKRKLLELTEKAKRLLHSENEC